MLDAILQSLGFTLMRWKVIGGIEEGKWNDWTHIVPGLLYFFVKNRMKAANIEVGKPIKRRLQWSRQEKMLAWIREMVRRGQIANDQMWIYGKRR